MIEEIKTFSYITFLPSRKEMYIRNSRIFLTTFDCIFINFLIDNNGYCNIDTFCNMLCKGDKYITKKCIVVYINRLRKKIYIQTGERIIRSRYSYGYYLAP